jgi:hypothetical protein
VRVACRNPLLQITPAEQAGEIGREAQLKPLDGKSITYQESAPARLPKP